MNLAPCATCGSTELDARVVYPRGVHDDDNEPMYLTHVICKVCLQEWVE